MLHLADTDSPCGQANDNVVVIDSPKDFEDVINESMAVVDCKWSRQRRILLHDDPRLMMVVFDRF